MNSTNNEKAKEIFQDAESLYSEAIAEPERGKIRNASEKAWGATVRATQALILSRTRKEIDGSIGLSREFGNLMREDKEIKEKLEGRFYNRQGSLHGECFYMGTCEPNDQIERRIRETIQYIEDAKRLAGI